MIGTPSVRVARQSERGQPALHSRRLWLYMCLYGSLGVGAAAVFWPVVRYLLPRNVSPDPEAVSTVAVCLSSELGERQARFVRIGDRAIWAVRLDGGVLRAFDAACPHLGCTVHYAAGQAGDRGALHCPCHGAEFELLSGMPVRGPAHRALQLLPVQVRHYTIIVGA